MCSKKWLLLFASLQTFQGDELQKDSDFLILPVEEITSVRTPVFPGAI